MSDKFQDKYRIPSNRLPGWDYGSNAAYFVTICSYMKEPWFGEIADGEMIFSNIGKIANQYWLEIPNHFPFVKLDAFIIMPDHIHGIVIIDKNGDKQRGKTLIDGGVTSIHNGGGTSTHDGGITSTHDVETPESGVSTTPRPTNAAKLKWYSGTLGVIINQYKRKCTIDARKIIPDFKWQSRFYDHIIRDEKSFQKIVEYIHDNPMNLDVDGNL